MSAVDGRAERRPVDAPRTIGEADLAVMGWRRQAGPFRALGHTFSVRSTDAAVGAYLASVLSPLAGGDGARTLYSVVAVGGGDSGGSGAVTVDGPDAGFALYEGSDLLVASTDAVFVVDMLLWTINQGAVRHTPERVLIHAAAAGDGHGAALFPGPSGSGKTTLVAGLVQGGLRYFTDETVAIDPASGLVHPYPRSLSVKEGSRAALAALRPERPESLRRFGGGQWHLDPRRIGPGGIADPAPPALVVVPRFVAGVGTRIEPLSRADAVVLLARSTFNLAHHGPAGLAALAGVARSSACYRLVMGDLAVAVELVLDLVADPARAGGA